MAIYADAAVQAVRTLLEFIGEDPQRLGLRATPLRVLDAWKDSWGAGYHDPLPDLTSFREPGVNYDEMVIVQGISFCSHCEHHIAPFFGTCDIGYIPEPDKGILGLSKLARVVDHFARRLQVQERLTAQIAGHLLERVSPNVAVTMRATHMCMVSRGVQQANARTVTSAMKGVFFDDTKARAEFLALTRP